MNNDTLQSVGGRLRDARTAAGLSADDVMVAIRDLLPKPKWITHTTVTRIETGGIKPDKLDVALLAALCEIYGKNLGEVLPELVPDAEAVVRLFDQNRKRPMASSRSRWFVTTTPRRRSTDREATLPTPFPAPQCEEAA